MGLSYLLPQLPNLGSPGLALCKEVVAGVPLSTPTPPALVIICLPDLILKVGAYRCVAWEQLVVLAGNVLGSSLEEFTPDTPTQRVLVLSPGVSQANIGVCVCVLSVICILLHVARRAMLVAVVFYMIFPNPFPI